jgi:hypothetical protein
MTLTCKCENVNEFLNHISFAANKKNHYFETNLNEIDMILVYFQIMYDDSFPYRIFLTNNFYSNKSILIECIFQNVNKEE